MLRDLGERFGLDFLIVLQTAGVDNRELDAAPVGRAIDAVASRAWLVFNDGAPFADKRLNSVDLPTFGRPTMATIGLATSAP